MQLPSDIALNATNPVAAAPNGIAGFFSMVGGMLGQAGTAVAQNLMAEQNARSTAKVQKILNDNHKINPSTGANDPNAAQTAANRTFLEKFLPSEMLYKTDVTTGARTMTPVFYAVIAGLGLLVVLIIVKLLRR